MPTVASTSQLFNFLAQAVLATKLEQKNQESSQFHFAVNSLSPLKPNNSPSNPKKSPPKWQFSYLGGTPEPLHPQEATGESGFPLTQVYPGQRVQLLKVRGGRIQHLLRRGLVAGDILTVLSVHPSGSVIIAATNQQIGLGAGIAQDLIVTEINESQ